MNPLYNKCQTRAPSYREQTMGLNLLLGFMTLFAYWQVGSNEFINFDTYSYIHENPHVRSGLTLENVIWSFTSTYKANWHPLTWLSHMLDVQLFGLAAGPHHLVNLLLHIVNSLLLFYLFRVMTRVIWPSFLVAALFAIHPLHVESVAWVAERKDVLSSCFWILTLISYCRYVEQPGVKRYAVVFLFLGLGLMAKSMLVTLPFVLLLLDYWPLGRFKAGMVGEESASAYSLTKLIWEKVPLFLLAAISSAITFYAQHTWDSVVSIQGFPITARGANSLVSYLAYLGKAIWPAQLAIFYPFRNLPPWQVVTAALLFSAICFMVVRYSKSRPWLMVGWLWYLGTLVPVIGLVQVGNQAMADRYSYIPLIGIFIIIAWSLAEFVTTRPRLKSVIIAMISVLLVMLVVTTRVQVRHWRNNISLFKQTLASTASNPLAHYNLARSLSELGRFDEADLHFAEALRLEPATALTHFGYGKNLENQGKVAQAEIHYEIALRLDVEQLYYSHALHVNLGIIDALRGDFAKARAHFREAVRIDPEYGDAHYNLANVMADQGRHDQAIRHFSEALRIEPKYAEAFYGLGNVMVSLGRFAEADKYFSEALRLSPDDMDIRRRVESARQIMAGRDSYLNGN